MHIKLRLTACCLAAALALCGCASSAPEEIPAPENGALRLTQEAQVNKEAFREEAEFGEFLEAAQPEFLIPGLEQHMIPQGIAWSENTGMTYLSAYSASPSTPSVIAAVDGETGVLLAEYWLYEADGSPFCGHVGGVAAAGSWLYLSAGRGGENDYRIAKIDLSSLPTEGSSDVTLDTFVKVQTSPSFLNFSGGYLWIGNFYHPDKDYGLPDSFSQPVSTPEGDQGCFILACQTDEDGNLILDGDFPEVSFVLSGPDRIQGFCAREDTLYLSQSYGRKNNSRILLYDASALSDSTISLRGQEVPLRILGTPDTALTAMPMAEGLCLSPKNGVYVLFESGAKKYKDGLFRTDFVWEMG